MSQGISKNTYKITLRTILPIFEGRGLDVRGIRNIKHAMLYILKRVRNTRDIYVNNITLYELFNMTGLTELAIAESIKPYNSLDD